MGTKCQERDIEASGKMLVGVLIIIQFVAEEGVGLVFLHYAILTYSCQEFFHTFVLYSHYSEELKCFLQMKCNIVVIGVVHNKYGHIQLINRHFL